MASKVEIDILANDRTGGVLGGIKSGLGGILQTAAGFVTGQVFMQAAGAIKDFATSSITAASDLNESLTKTAAIFGDEVAGSLIKWAESGAVAYGQSEQAMLDAAAGMGTFGKAAGLAGTDLESFVKDNVGLATDMASFWNASSEQVSTAIQAAFRGETEPIRRYGVMLDDASMRQKALELGIVSTTKDALTPQQKVLAANALIWEQTKDAQGDFAKTSDGMANQQRILNAQLENSKTVLGTAFLPMITSVMSFINTQGIPILLDIIDKVKGFIDSFSQNIDIEAIFGSIMDGFAAIGDFLGSIDWAGLWDGLVDAVMGIWTVIKSIDWAGLWDVLVDSVKMVWNFIEPIWNSLLALFDTLKVWWDTNGPPIIDAFTQVFEGLQSFFETISKNASPFISETLDKLGQWFTDNGPYITQIVQFIADVWTNYLLPAIQAAVEFIMPLLDMIVDQILYLGTLILQIATGDWSGAWETMKSIVQNTVDYYNYILTYLGEMIMNIIQPILDWITEAWSNTWNGIIDFYKTAYMIIIGLVLMLADGILHLFGTSLEEVKASTLSGLTTVKNTFVSIFNGIKSFIAPVLTWIKTQWNTMTTALKLAVNNAYNGIKPIIDNFKNIGRSIIAGIVNGLNSAKKAVVDTLLSIANNAIDAFKNFFGIQSPSKVFAGFGENMMKGLANGIGGGTTIPVKALMTASNDLVGGFSVPSSNAATAGGIVINIDATNSIVDERWFATKFKTGVVQIMRDAGVRFG